MSATSPRPSLEELRAVAQPASIFARNSGEHWAGRLYIRRKEPRALHALATLRGAFPELAGEVDQHKRWMSAWN